VLAILPKADKKVLSMSENESIASTPNSPKDGRSEDAVRHAEKKGRGNVAAFRIMGA